MSTRELDSARGVVTGAELEALEQAEELRREAEALLAEAKAEAARIVQEGRQEAEDAALEVRRDLVRQMLGLRDALTRADSSFEAFLQALARDPEQ